MKRWLFLLLMAWSAAAHAATDTMSGVVIVVIDGDTVLFRPDHYDPSARAFLKVRLADIDAPEKDQPHGEAATLALQDLMLKQRAELDIVATDAYGRKVGRLNRGAVSVAAEMVRMGAAWATTREQGEIALQEMQREARRARRGLWHHTWLIGEANTPSAGMFAVYDTPLGKLAAMICHDANYTDIARKLTANDAQIHAAPYREFGGFGEQAWTNALFRAVENRTAVVISGVATVSGIMNPDGSIVALDTDINGSRLTLVGDVTLGSGPTPYTSLGDILGWAMLAGYVFFMFYPSVVEKLMKKAVQSI